jgi:imidazolonepropionase-like amidohydrolase
MIACKVSAALLSLPLSALSAERPNGPQHFAIQGARVFQGFGDAIEDATVVVDRGLVVAVGRGIPIPEGAWVIDASGKNVYPGMIDALSSVGLATKKDSTEGRASSAPARGPEDRPATAQLFGVSDSLGSIEEGKTANLIVTDGDPLEIQTQVRYLFIDGKLTPLDNKHERLYQTYRARP